MDPGSLLYIVGVGAARMRPVTKLKSTRLRAQATCIACRSKSPEWTEIKVKYNQVGGSGAWQEERARFKALKLLLRGQMIDDGDSDDQFELLGLRGDIDIHIDPVTRAPIQTGRQGEDRRPCQSCD